MVTAVIGIGSNSVRMLVARVDGNTGERIRRDRAGTRLFAGLDENGNLDRAAMEKTVGEVARMAREARETDGAEEVLLFATSATRDAANKDAFARMLREQAGVELTVCSGEEEAALSFLGATGEGRCGVIDIGGGSTEVVVGCGTQLDCAFSCQMGAVRLFREMAISSRDDVERVKAHAAGLIREKLAQQRDVCLPDAWFGTGGTFTTLAAMVRGVRWTERTFMHGTVLTPEAVKEQAMLLAEMPMEERLRLPGLQPNRADIVVHGICILLACMEQLGIRALTVTEYGNLDGYVKLRYGLSGGLK